MPSIYHSSFIIIIIILVEVIIYHLSLFNSIQQEAAPSSKGEEEEEEEREVYKPKARKEPKKESEANAFSRMLFNWVGGVLKTGFLRPLQMDDVPDLSPNDLCDPLTSELQQLWDQEKQTALAENKFVL